MIATMVTGDPDPEDLRKFFRALRRAQRDIDLRPELYTHYYKNEFPVRYHAMMDTRRWGPGERLVFEPYTKEVYEETFKWIADHGIFADSGMGAGKYEDAVITRGVARRDRRGRSARAPATPVPFVFSSRASSCPTNATGMQHVRFASCGHAAVLVLGSNVPQAATLNCHAQRTQRNALYSFWYACRAHRENQSLPIERHGARGNIRIS